MASFFKTHHTPYRTTLHCQNCRSSLFRHRVFSHPEENAESRGDAALQEELVRQIQRSMGKQRLIEAARRSVEQAEKDRLKSKLKDAKENIEKREKLELDRNKLEYESRQADVNKAADDFDDILRKSRADLETSRAEFEAFEKMVEQDQNRHLFFQGLYKREQEKKKAKNRRISQQEATRHMSPILDHTQQQAPRSDSFASVERAMRIIVYALTAFNISALTLTGANALNDKRHSATDLLVVFCAILLVRSIWLGRRRFFS